MINKIMEYPAIAHKYVSLIEKNKAIIVHKINGIVVVKAVIFHSIENLSCLPISFAKAVAI